MRLSIAKKLFLVILACIVILVISMHLSLQWSFDRGFSRYVATLEQKRFDALVVKLEETYAVTGSWDFIAGRAELWAAVLLSTAPDEGGMMRQRHNLSNMLQGREGMHQPMMHRTPRPFELRVVLLDAERNRLWGPVDTTATATFHTLAMGPQKIGYLGLIPGEALTDTRQIEFVEQQKTTMLLVAIFTALFAAILCVPLSRKLARPVGRLAEGTRALTRGQFGTRIPVTSNDELGQLTQDFNLLAKTLEQNEVARKQWVADISHELRTPLSILQGEIEALQDGVRAVTPQQLESLHSEALHLGRLVEDLYQLSMSDIGALNYRKIRLDFRNILQDVVDLYRGRLAGKNITLETDISNETVMLEADPRRLQQLLENLFENSLRYTDPDGRLIITLKHDDAYVTLHLQDTAPKVSAEDLPHLFERLYRVESSRTRNAGGAGLGLSICQNIAEAHGGDIQAQDSALGGLWVSVRLPRSGQ